jgi:hypothetical protein
MKSRKYHSIEPNGEMIITQLTNVKSSIEDILMKLDAKSNLDPWIASKVAVIEHSVEAVESYIKHSGKGEGKEE